MTASDLDLTPPQVADQHVLPQARSPTVEDTPTHWTLPAAVAWILDRDLSAVLELCEPPGGTAIDRGARRLRGHKVLWALASRALGIDAEQGNKAIDAVVQKARADHAAGELTDKEAWYRAHQEARTCIEQLQLENAKIAGIIYAAMRDLFAKLAEKKLTAEDDNTDAIPARRFYRVPSSSFSRHLFFESQIGPHKDVRIARQQVLACWPDPDGMLERERIEESAAGAETLVEEAPPKKVKPPRGYAIADAPLVREIIELYRTGRCHSLWEAAQQVAPRAKGRSGEPLNKAKRLHRRATAEWKRGDYQKIAEA